MKTPQLDKNLLLQQLVRKRQLDDQSCLSRIYKKVGDIHGGIYDSWGHVSPWSKSACNVDASVMIVAQDWTSEDAARQQPKNFELGYTPELPTNRNLQAFLKDYFNMSFADVYATNLFVFIKPGNLSTRIPSKDLLYSARTYTLMEIQIVKPRIVICLGSATFKSICKAIGVKPPDFKNSLDNPVKYGEILVFGVPHTGGLGTKNAGGLENVRKTWAKLGSLWASHGTVNNLEKTS